MPRRPDPFEHETRDGTEYRAERIDGEIERLQQRIEWAERRQDYRTAARLERRLSELLGEAGADLSPGREPTRFDRGWR